MNLTLKRFGKGVNVILFFSDLDNTLIYSYKHDIGKRYLVEKKGDKELSYITEYTYTALKHLFLQENIMFVPVTTRSEEQYKRIEFPHGFVPEFAIVSNGGVLLHNGNKEPLWEKLTADLVNEVLDELQRGRKFLEEEGVSFEEVRLVDNVFIYTKCHDVKSCINSLSDLLDLNKVVIESNNEKIYIIPKTVNKGEAVRRFGKAMGADCIIAGGDSVLDLPMLYEADIAVFPQKLRRWCAASFKNAHVVSDNEFLSDAVLKFVLDMV